jgi:hypothetical protein
MRPPSFEEFMAKHSTGKGTEGTEPLSLTECPIPECSGKKLFPKYKDGLLTNFTCENGCSFSVHRNIFTNDIVFYQLDSFIESHFLKPQHIRGLKFNPVGQKYVDWY